jgi:hypothetical protein
MRPRFGGVSVYDTNSIALRSLFPVSGPRTGLLVLAETRCQLAMEVAQNRRTLGPKSQ